MARGVISHGATQDEAEAAVRRDAPQLRILRSKRLDLSDFGPARMGRLGDIATNSWVVVVEHPEPENDPLPPQASPEQETEATFRLDLARIFG
jgi:hypothetical protein